MYQYVHDIVFSRLSIYSKLNICFLELIDRERLAIEPHTLLKTKVIDFCFRQFVKSFPSWRLGDWEQEAIQSKAHEWAHFRSVHTVPLHED